MVRVKIQLNCRYSGRDRQSCGYLRPSQGQQHCRTLTNGHYHKLSGILIQHPVGRVCRMFGDRQDWERPRHPRRPTSPSALSHGEETDYRILVCCLNKLYNVLWGTPGRRACWAERFAPFQVLVQLPLSRSSPLSHSPTPTRAVDSAGWKGVAAPVLAV
jgi:hypothetical protein